MNHSLFLHWTLFSSLEAVRPVSCVRFLTRYVSPSHKERQWQVKSLVERNNLTDVGVWLFLQEMNAHKRNFIATFKKMDWLEKHLLGGLTGTLMCVIQKYEVRACFRGNYFCCAPSLFWPKLTMCYSTFLIVSFIPSSELRRVLRFLNHKIWLL